MEEKDVAQNVAEQPPVVNENPAPAKSAGGCKSISGDKRTFVISLLVAVITVLVYHCITYWYCQKECTPEAKKIYVIHQNGDNGCPPCPAGKQFGRNHDKGGFRRFNGQHHGRKGMKQNFRNRKRIGCPGKPQQAPAPAAEADEQAE